MMTESSGLLALQQVAAQAAESTDVAAYRRRLFRVPYGHAEKTNVANKRDTSTRTAEHEQRIRRYGTT
jgi:hypothetical protein